MHQIWRRLASLCLPRLPIGVLGILAILTSQAEAHVKWFCGAVDVTRPPLALAAVLSPTLLVLGAASMTLVSAGGGLDTLALRRWPLLLRRGSRSELLEEALIRFGVGAYMLLLWARIGVAPWSTAGEEAVLTPELLAQAAWVGWLQLATAVMVVFRRTCPFAGLGMFALYGIGVADYGLFHMTDYTIFVGLAGYLALSHPFFDRRPRWQQWRVPLIAATLAFSLMWTGIEKFLYPVWAAVILTAHPIITLSFPQSFVTVAAGSRRVQRGLLSVGGTQPAAGGRGDRDPCAAGSGSGVRRAGHGGPYSLRGDAPGPGASRAIASAAARLSATGGRPQRHGPPGCTSCALRRSWRCTYGLQKAGTWPG